MELIYCGNKFWSNHVFYRKVYFGANACLPRSGLLAFFAVIAVTCNPCFPIYCQLQNCNPRGKVKQKTSISQAKKQMIYLQFPGIMWEGVDWISCYYSQYKAEKASKKFEGWPWPDWE